MPSFTVTMDQALKAGERNHGPAFSASFDDAIEGDWLRNGETVTGDDLASFFGCWFDHDGITAGHADKSGKAPAGEITLTFHFDSEEDAVHYLLKYL